MKKFKLLLLSALAILTCLSLVTVNLKADSGWDSGYDSGWDSGYDSGWDSGWDSGSSWSSSSGSGGGSWSSAVVMLVIIIVVIIILSSNNKGSSTVVPSALQITKPSVPDSTLENYGLDRVDILEHAFKIYRDVQVAWMNFDYDTLRKYLSDELFNTYKMQLNALSMKKQKNVMKDFLNRQMVITDVAENDGLITLTIELVVAQTDYVVDENDNLVKGIRTRQMLVHYELTFTMTKETNVGRCPNCNAPLANQASSKCPYCGSTVVTKNHDLIMTKKQNKGQGWN